MELSLVFGKWESEIAPNAIRKAGFLLRQALPLMAGTHFMLLARSVAGLSYSGVRALLILWQHMHFYY